MTPMSELERFAGLSALLCYVMLCAICVWFGNTNERMARDGFMPLRLQGESAVYWLPIPTDKVSDHLREMLKH